MKDLQSLVLTREEVRACDQLAVSRYSINSLILMENAGRNAATKLVDLLSAVPSKVCIIAGPGNNGGDGFVAARHLLNAGHDVKVLITRARDEYKGDALANLVILEKMACAIKSLCDMELETIKSEVKAQLQGADWVVDGMLGTGASGPAREPIRSIIEVINEAEAGVLALDIPSGLDCNCGETMGLAVKADHTVTFAAMKKGFLNPKSSQYTGVVTVADIGIDARLLL